MKYEISEILNTAIMTNTISVVVEGVDDIQIYDAIAKSEGKVAEIFPIETIEGFSPGCSDVITAMDEIIAISQTQHEYNKYIVGILDKDVKDFRGELPTNPLILILNYYSMESHFIGRHILPNLLELVTKVPQSLITEDLINYYYHLISLEDEDLFLVSLESLKTALNEGYDSKFSYSFSEGRVFSDTDINNVRQKREELLAFAAEKNLSNSLDDLRRFSKGKWLLHYFCVKAIRAIERLKIECGTHPVKQCVMCAGNGKLEQHCLYKPKDSINTKNLKCFLIKNVWIPDFDYIRNVFKVMI